MRHLGRGRGPMVCKLKKVPASSSQRPFHDRLVAGQLPNGWDATQYGIPKDIIARTDRVSLWALVATAEALNHVGITDAYELYQYTHPSEVRTSLGSSMGGMTSLSQTFKDRRDEKEVQSDISRRR